MANDGRRTVDGASPRVDSKEPRGGTARRRALLQIAVLATAAGTGSRLLGEGRVSAATGNLQFGATNEAGGSSTVLNSSFQLGDNFTVNTKAGGAGAQVTSIVGAAGGSDGAGGAVFGVAGTARGDDGTATPDYLFGVVGKAFGPSAIQSCGVTGSAIGLGDSTGVGIGVQGTGFIGVRAKSLDNGPALDVIGRAQILGDLDGSGAALEVTGQSSYTGRATFASTVQAADFIGGGAGLTGLNASALAVGSVPDRRLSANVAMRGAATNNFKGMVRAAGFSGPKGSAPTFSTAHVATIPAGRASLRVTDAAVKQSSIVLVTLQSNPGAVATKFVKAGNGFFTIALTGKVAAATKMGYLVVGAA